MSSFELEVKKILYTSRRIALALCAMIFCFSADDVVITFVGSESLSLAVPFPCRALFFSRGAAGISAWRLEGGRREADIARASWS